MQGPAAGERGAAAGGNDLHDHLAGDIGVQLELAEHKPRRLVELVGQVQAAHSFMGVLSQNTGPSRAVRTNPVKT